MEFKEDGHGRGESPTAGTGSGSDYFGSPESLQQNSAEWDQEKMRGSSGKTQRKVKRERESDTLENFAKTALPRGPNTAGREGTDTTRMGPRCPKIGRAPGATMKAKKRFCGNA